MDKKFSTKDKVIFILVAAFCVCLFLPAVQNKIISIAEMLLHRTLRDHAKWKRLMNIWSLIGLYTNCVILLGRRHRFKFSDTEKTILLLPLLAVIIFLIIFMHTKMNNIINSDDAGEMLLWKECFLQKSLMPRSWYYSTEIRILNTQIFGAIFFALFSNWVLIKTCVSLCSLAVLFFAAMFLLKRLDVKESWARLLCAILVIAPTSHIVWSMMTFGNYYIPHAVISFFYVGLFIDLVNEKNPNGAKHRKIKTIIFAALAFFSGLASIRYLLTITFPLAAIMTWKALFQINFEKFHIKGFLTKNKFVFYSVMGLMICFIGYSGNLLLHKFYNFYNYSNMRFTAPSIKLLETLFNGLLQIIGYRSGVLIFSIAGIVNIFVLVTMSLFISMVTKSFKFYMPVGQKILLFFFAANFIFNTFVFMVTPNFVDRYYLPITVYIVPCAFVLIFNETFHKIKRFALGVTLTIALLASTFGVSKDIIRSRKQNRIAVTNFLKDNYSFGYATFWNANVLTALTDGKVETGILGNYGENYETYNWLTPKRYYVKDFKNDEKIFLLITTEEFKRNSEYNILRNGTQVYADNFYRVYEYENHDAFRNGF